MAHWREKGLITLTVVAICIYPFQILLCAKINSIVLHSFLKILLDDLRG